MTTLNLLPWRAACRRQRERDFYGMLGAAAACAALASVLWIYGLDARSDAQSARNAYLQDQIHQLDGRLAQIKALQSARAVLISRERAIAQLQIDRARSVQLFDQLAKTIPDGIRLGALKQNGDRLVLQGVAQANGDVARYLHNLDCSRWLAHSDLQKTEVKGVDRRHRYEFILSVQLGAPDQAIKSACADADATQADAISKAHVQDRL